MSSNAPRLLILGAHPDDAEFHAGGIASVYRAMGREVKMVSVTDGGAVEAACRAVLDASPKQVAQYRAGKTGVMGYFVGQVMKATGAQADPKAVDAALRKLLDAGDGTSSA